MASARPGLDGSTALLLIAAAGYGPELDVAGPAAGVIPALAGSAGLPVTRSVTQTGSLM